MSATKDNFSDFWLILRLTHNYSLLDFLCLDKHFFGFLFFEMLLDHKKYKEEKRSKNRHAIPSLNRMKLIVL